MTSNKLFLDTNVWLRYFIKTNQNQYEHSLKLILQAEQGKIRLYTSTVVLMEINHVAQRIYQIPKAQIIIWFKAIQKIRNITIINKTNFDLALNLYENYNIKLADCIIASQLPVNVILVSFDEELPKIKEIIVKKPQEIE